MSADYYDMYGWHTADAAFSGRVADAAPASVPASRVVGQPFPNWTGYVWMDLPYSEPLESLSPPTPADPRHITPLAFRRRFTKAERAAVEWAAVDKPDRPEAERQMAAALRADLKDQEQAKFIDLDDPDLIEGVATLEAYGLIAEGRAAEILSAPVQSGERA